MEIVDDTNRASAVIARVRQLAKKAPFEKSLLNLRDVISEVCALARYECAARQTTIRAELADDLPSVPGDRVQLQQVLLNLVVNGMDAMSATEEQDTQNHEAAAKLKAYLKTSEASPDTNVPPALPLDLIYNHITARIPGSHDHLLINLYGMLYKEITASSLVKIDVHGNKLQDSPFPVNPAGFVIHSAIHAARHDARCVLHTHTLNGVAVSAQRAGLLPISQHSMAVLASLGYHDFEGPALRDDEKPRLVADLGDKTSLILRNHGLLTVGETVAEAFVAMYYLEASCAIQVRAQAGGGELVPVPKEIIESGGGQVVEATRPRGSRGSCRTVRACPHSAENPSRTSAPGSEARTPGSRGMLVWPGLLRRLDRLDASYQD